MNVKLFEDTDTALLEFSSHAVAQTREINENIHVDLDAAGNLVNMTIEHARQNTTLPDVAVEQISAGAA